MGTIIERVRADKSIAYMAQISIMRDRKIVRRESKTFDRRAAAANWIKRREAELAKPGAIEIASADRHNPTLRDVIDKYIQESAGKIGRSKKQVLTSIKKTDLADMACSDITSQAIVGFASDMRAGRSPATIAGYLSHLSSLFTIAKPAWGYPLDERAMADAFVVTKRLGLTGKSRRRQRRPTMEEMEKLLDYFEQRRRGPAAILPMQILILFGLFSSRRQEEITRLRWADLDREGKRILIRDMKHPGEKDGNDVWCTLPDAALQMIDLMPQERPEIFPYESRSISSSFTRACVMLGIEDLHFHDLRHEGISRLFEMGTDIPVVAGMSGHRSWETLKRYTHLRQTGDKYAGWSWLGPGRVPPPKPIPQSIIRPQIRYRKIKHGG